MLRNITTRYLAQVELTLAAVKTQIKRLSNVPTGSMNIVCFDPSSNRNWLSTHSLVLLENWKETSFYFLPLQMIFFKWRMFSFLSLYLNYFSFIPVCTSFELKLFDRFSEEISVEHASKFTTQNQYLISGLLWLTFLHVHSVIAYVHHCFMVRGSPRSAS